MTSVIELVRCRKSGRTAADDSHFPAASVQRDPRRHPAISESRLDDIELIVVDRDRITVHPADAGLLTERRTHAPGELREIAGLKESGQSVPGVIQIHLVVPLRDHVVQGTARYHARQLHRALAHGHAAVHAARSLFLSLLLAERQMKLQIIRQSLHRLSVNIVLPLILQKSCRFSHNAPRITIIIRSPGSCAAGAASIHEFIRDEFMNWSPLETPPIRPCRGGFPAPRICRLP